MGYSVGSIDGKYDATLEKAVLSFKKSKGLGGGSDVGSKTWKAMLPTLKLGEKNDAVKGLKKILHDKFGFDISVSNNEYGEKTQRYVIDLQYHFDLTPDGIVDEEVWSYLIAAKKVNIASTTVRLAKPSGGWLSQVPGWCKMTAISNAVNSISGKKTMTKISGAPSASTTPSAYRGSYDFDNSSKSKNNKKRQIDAIESAVSNHLPIVVQIRGSNGADSHWVTVIGKKGGKYLVVDSLNGQESLQSEKYFNGSKSGYYGYVSFKRP